MQAATAARDWSALPDTALVAILLAAPPDERLSCCALVSRSWAAAAVVATQEVSVNGPPDVSCIIAPLSRRFSAVRALEVCSCSAGVLSALPALHHLQELHLVQTRVQLGPGLDQPGVLSSATALTYLLLQDVTVVGGLEAVSVLTRLSSLTLINCEQLLTQQEQHEQQQQPPMLVLGPAGPSAPGTAPLPDYSSSSNACVPVPGSIFLQLLQLTYLELRGGLNSSSLQHISRLTKLDSLAIDFEGASTTAAAVHGLDKLSDLTFLALTDSDVDLNADTVPGLSKLTALQALWLYNCRSIDPQLLAPLTNLQHLDLDNTPPDNGAAGVSALLSVLPKLRALTHLDLCDCLLDSSATPAAAFSALTANSNLAYLDIRSADYPVGAWSAMLPASQPLTQLQRLHLAGLYHASSDALNEQQLQHLVAACPGLQHLQCSVQQEVVPTALLQLTALTGLALDYATDDIVQGVLLELGGLQELHILPDSSVGDDGLARLTALTQLSLLGIHHDAWTPGFEQEYRQHAVQDGEDLVLLFDAEAHPAGAPRDVWLRLLQCSMKSFHVDPLGPVQHLRARLQDANRQLLDLQQQLQDHGHGGVGGSGRARCFVEAQLEAAQLRVAAAQQGQMVELLSKAVAVVAECVHKSGGSCSTVS